MIEAQTVGTSGRKKLGVARFGERKGTVARLYRLQMSLAIASISLRSLFCSCAGHLRDTFAPMGVQRPQRIGDLFVLPPQTP